MKYSDLLKRNICLAGNGKILYDISAFFHEMNVVQRLQTPTDADRYSHGSIGTIIVCSDDLVWQNVLGKRCLPFISYKDLFVMIDELETFYLDKNHYGKEIFIYGNGEMKEQLIQDNPNLKVDGFIEKIPKFRDGMFVIIAREPNAEIKAAFLSNGFRFGTDFHFFRPDKPKHYPSYYLNKTISDSLQFTLPCDYTGKALSIKHHGNVMACCSAFELTFGNCLYTSIEEIIHGIPAQIALLSIKNRTYSFCSNLCFMYRNNGYRLSDENEIQNNPRREQDMPQIKDFVVQLGYDRSCNLACPSCRAHRITFPEDPQHIVQMIHDEAKSMTKLHPKNLRIGNGELFFSKYYRDIVFNSYESNSISLITNGILFNGQNWNKLRSRYKKIAIEFSIDAVTEDTYTKLRRGNFIQLLENLHYASILRKMGEMLRFSISFVIQVENFREMVDFVEMGNSLGADCIHFMKLNNFGHISKDAFVQMDVYDPNNYHHSEFVDMLTNPCFRLPNVKFDNLNNFLEAL